LSVRRLDVVLGRLLPDGDLLPGGEKHLQALGGMAILDRGRRDDAQKLFAGGPAQPGVDPDFAVRLVAQFAAQSRAAFQTADGDEYRFCETIIDVSGPGGAWERLTRPCIPAPEPPVRDLASYDACVAGLPLRFWTQNSDTEIEYVGQVDGNRLTNLGTVERTAQGFKVTANSASRAADITAVVADAVAAAGLVGKVVSQSARTADEMLGGNEAEDAPDGRETMCRRLGLDAALTAAPPRKLILEGHFLPIEQSAEGESLVREISRELGIRSMLAARTYDGRTAAEAVAAGGAARDSVLAMIDDCEWRLVRAEDDGQDTSFMPLPDELRRRVGLP
jgi:hypothetical protein